MLLVTLTVREGMSREFKYAVLDAVHSALVASGVPEKDKSTLAFPWKRPIASAVGRQSKPLMALLEACWQRCPRRGTTKHALSQVKPAFLDPLPRWAAAVDSPSFGHNVDDRDRVLLSLPRRRTRRRLHNVQGEVFVSEP